MVERLLNLLRAGAFGLSSAIMVAITIFGLWQLFLYSIGFDVIIQDAEAYMFLMLGWFGVTFAARFLYIDQ